jgi:hypothetical protein
MALWPGGQKSGKYSTKVLRLPVWPIGKKLAPAKIKPYPLTVVYFGSPERFSALN